MTKTNERLLKTALLYQQYYNTHGAESDGVVQAGRHADLDTLLTYIAKKAEVEPGMTVLDCGSGVGRPAAFMAQLGAVVVGVSLVPDEVALAREQYGTLPDGKPGPTFHNADFDKVLIKLPAGGFDRIVFLESIGHTADLTRCLESAACKLKAGGLIYIKHFVLNDTEGPIAGPVADYKCFQTSRLLNAAMKAGLEVVEVSNIAEQLEGFIDGTAREGREPIGRFMNFKFRKPGVAQ